MRVLVPALLTFAAGLVFGFAAGRGLGRAPMVPLDPDLAAYEAGLSRVLDLRPQQRADLRTLLYHYAEQRRVILDSHRAELEPELADLDARVERHILTRVLDDDQRARAAALAEPAGEPTAASLPAGPGPR
ncbi:MAG: hypothetical protein D6702_02990 [Planctomycetota bacterium]|nr:MAG: hypothetical protein D6702_02990 [Planctomycetota bacterium]